LLVRPRAPGLLGRRIAESTATPVVLLVVAVGMRLIFGELAETPRLRRLPAARYLDSATYLLIVAAATWVAYGLVKGVSGWYISRITPGAGSKLDVEFVPLVRRVFQVLLLFTALTVVFDHYNIKLTALLGVAGVASLAGALAAQDTLANMIAGFTIMLDRPFRIGDRVELQGGRLGDVFEIGLRSTRILSPDHTVHIIPNAELAKSSIINHSYPDQRVNVRQQLRIAYGNDVEAVKRAVLEICRAHPQVLPDPPPNALLGEMTDQTLAIHFNFWIADHRQRGTILDEVLAAIYAYCAKAEVRAPAQRMEVVLTNPAAPHAAPGPTPAA
jgi:small-conductance mechanosensitive channel